MTPENKEREAFEVWAANELLPLGKEHPFFDRNSVNGEYTRDWMLSRWEAWQARSQVTGEAAPAEGAEGYDLDPRMALDYARRMKAYCESFNDRDWAKVSLFGSVDEKNLAGALDNLIECAAMLMNMASRVAASPSMGAQRGSAGDAGAPFAKGSWQHAVDDHLVGYGKTSEEFASSHDAVAWLLAQVSDAACLNKGDSAASPTPDAPTDQAATVSPPPSAPRPS